MELAAKEVHSTSCPPLSEQLATEYSELKAKMFPGKDVISRGDWIGYEGDIQDCKVLSHLKVCRLQALYLSFVYSGVFGSESHGKWVYFVGDGNDWNDELFDSEDAAIEAGCQDSNEGYPSVVYVAELGRKVTLL